METITGPDFDDIDDAIVLSDSDKPEAPLPPLPADALPTVLTRLDMATEDELIDELGRRNMGVVVIMAREPQGRPHQELVSVRHRGGFSQAVGLATCAQKYFARQI